MSTHRSDVQLRDRDLCFIDTETTGSLIGFHELIEVAAIRTSSDGLVTRGEWSTRIAPEFPMRATSFAQALNGFSMEAWVGAPPSSPSLWRSFANFVTGCIPVCHNPSFDRAFVSLAAGKQGVTDLNLDYHWIGVESIAWPLYRMGLIPKLSLADVCRFVGVPPEPAKHGALGGAAACREVYIRLIGCSLVTPPVSRLNVQFGDLNT